MLCKLVVSLQMQNRKTTDKINEISIVPNPPNYSIVAIADQRALHLHFATDNQLAKPCSKVSLPGLGSSSSVAKILLYMGRLIVFADRCQQSLDLLDGLLI